MKKTSIYPSPIRYAGGKQKQAKWIINYFPKQFKEYREPFVGGGSVGLKLRQQEDRVIDKFWINDFDPKIYYFWIGAQNHNERNAEYYDRMLEIKKVEGVEFIKKHFWKGMVRCLDFDVFGTNYFMVNKMGFNGLSSFSEASCITKFTESSIKRYRNVKKDLVGTKITNWDFQEVIEKDGEDVVMYLDPPYYRYNQALYKDHDNFEHKRLCEVLKQTKHRWVMSYDDNKYIRDLYKDFYIYEHSWKYSMAQKGGKLRTGGELIITNFKNEMI